MVLCDGQKYTGQAIIALKKNRKNKTGMEIHTPKIWGSKAGELS